MFCYRTFATDLKAVSSLGITHILNLAPKDEPTGQEFYNEIGVKYYEIDTDDDPDFDLKIHFNSTCEIIDQAIQENGNYIYREIYLVQVRISELQMSNIERIIKGICSILIRRQW